MLRKDANAPGPAQPKRGRGRPPEQPPTVSDERIVKAAAKMAELGATDLEIAHALDVSLTTLMRWRHKDERFAKAICAGKEMADERVVRSLYARANGYSHEAVKFHVIDGTVVQTPYIEHVPPDTTACIFWLKNRRRQQWTVSGDGPDEDAPMPTTVSVEVVDASVPRE